MKMRYYVDIHMEASGQNWTDLSTLSYMEAVSHAERLAKKMAEVASIVILQKAVGNGRLRSVLHRLS